VRARPLRRALYVVFWLLGNLVFRLWFRMRVTGRPRPFPKGALVVAANHVSYLDPVLLALAVPRRVTYLVTASVFRKRAFRPWMWLFGCIPVRDEAVNVDAMRLAVAALRAGGVVGIFPEGGISDDGRLRDGEIGVAALLLKGRAPVLTAGLVGTFEALPRGGRFPRPRRIEVRFSERIDPDEELRDPRARLARRRLRDRVMAAIGRVLPAAMQPAVRPDQACDASSR
jgi:1-acyl-sn-glycerol-3-phosphate acyltransferase